MEIYRRGYGPYRCAPCALLMVFCVIVFCVTSLFAQAEWPRPIWRKVETIECRATDSSPSPSIEKTIGQYKVELAAFPQKHGERLCQAYLVDPAGRRTFLLEDANISIHQGTGMNLFGDGNAALVIEGYTGGSHCCYTYRIVNLGEHPLILPPIQNGSPFYFFKDKASGQSRIMTSDGDFDDFDRLCPGCELFPRVVLRVDSTGLHDASADFLDQYDSEIALANAKIGKDEIGRFLMSDFEDARALVLEIVYSYLYSGREAQAWQALDEMWPAKDRARIKQQILTAKAKGLLSKIEKTSPDSEAAP